MKRILLVLIALAVAAFAGWYYWNFSQKISRAPAAALLPRETIFVAQMPDFNRAYDEWQHCDIYQLYREPALQDFLRKPLSNVPKSDAVSQTLREIEQLAPKNAFIALTSIENNNPKVVGGFRFHGSQEEAERTIGRWRSALIGQNSNLKREKVQYERHEIEVAKAAPFSVATAYDPPWFFAATDVPELEALLDRADRRGIRPENRLDKDDAYRAAISHRSSAYVAFFYLQPKTFSNQLAALRAAVGSTPAPGEATMLEKMRCVLGSMQFENGKIHDMLFLGMPKLEHDDTTVTRSSVSLGTKDTFLYLAILLNLGEKMDTLNQAAAFAGTKMFQALGDSGITAADWKSAFGIELGSVADWPPSAHWPSLLVTLPVTDTTKASKIVEALLRADEDATWAQTDKDGVRYFSKQSVASLVAITPTIALSDRIVVAGLDPVSVEEAIKRSGSGSSELADSQTYKAATRLLPAPTNFFAYIDTVQLYSRLDASLRPMLLMAAAFVPAVVGSIDPGKLPAPEVITKHLSPIVSSQRYDRDGCVAESIGPITLDQLAIGIGIFSSLGTATRQINSSTPPAATAPPTSSSSPTP
jgi:hypothetical protein